MIEQFERRLLLSAELRDGVMVITGTEGNDRILVSLEATGVEANVNGVVEGVWALRKIQRIEIAALGGKDVVEVRGTSHDENDLTVHDPGVDLPAWIEGAAGNDLLIGGGGNDTLVGGSGR